LLSETAVHHPNHSPSLKAQRPARATTAKTYARTRSLCCELGRVLHSARWAEFAGRSKAFTGKNVAISARRHRSQQPSPTRRGFCVMCPASLAQHAKAAHKLAVAQNVCQRTDFSCSGAFGLTNFVFNVQTANFDAGKPCSAKIAASRERWKSNPAFPAQLLRHSPKLRPSCLSKIHHVFGQRRQNQTLRNQLDGSPP
jgi:hypothetical protein